MDFKDFNQRIKNQFVKMCKTGKLFRADVSGSEIWDLYLSSFEDEKVFRDPESSYHNCNCCKNFIRRYGNIVSIDSEGNIETLFSDIGNFKDLQEYDSPSKAIDSRLKSSNIKDVFFETYKTLNEGLNYESCNEDQDFFKLGIESNHKKYTQEEVEKFGVVNTEKVYEFNHFCIDLPKQFVDFSGRSIEEITAHYRDKYSVFKRAMEEISLDTLNLVRDLINQGSLLDGTSHLHSVEEFIKIWESSVPLGTNKERWFWQKSYELEERTAKFKNTLIGVLCSELSEGMELNKACENWNKRVDPVNYHKATAPITQRQIKEAKKFVQDNGYESSFDRRLATIDDIKSSEILHLNSGNGEIKEISVFDNVKATSTQHKRSTFDKVEEISIEKFMKDILPNCSSVEAFVENRMEGNFVTITKASDDNSKPIFKWDNNYSWTFNGNLAGKSQIKENVKSAGGNVTGFMRFSIQWNDKETPGIVDFDAHCMTPSVEIYYSHMKCTYTDGCLDVDMIDPESVGVENITWKNKSSIKDGNYRFFVKNFNNNNNTGFKAEIELNGEVYSYKKSGNLRGNTPVATITVKNGQFSIKHHLTEENQSKEIWGIETGQFHKVNLVCLSPNHWGKNKVGNLHYMFMLENSKAQNQIRGFHNENLLPELLKHRKVMEVLGATNMIEPTGKQLSGIGFNSTVRDEIIIKCSGNFKRMLKVKF
jgi:hypothetical protein